MSNGTYAPTGIIVDPRSTRTAASLNSKLIGSEKKSVLLLLLLLLLLAVYSSTPLLNSKSTSLGSSRS